MNTCNVHKNAPALNVPKTLVKDMKIEIKNADDKWQEIDGIKENHQRLVKIKIGKTTKLINKSQNTPQSRLQKNKKK